MTDGVLVDGDWRDVTRVWRDEEGDEFGDGAEGCRAFDRGNKGWRSWFDRRRAAFCWVEQSSLTPWLPDFYRGSIGDSSTTVEGDGGM